MKIILIALVISFIKFAGSALFAYLKEDTSKTIIDLIASIIVFIAILSI